MSQHKLIDHWKRLGIAAPDLHIVLGSGLSSAFAEGHTHPAWEEKGQVSFGEVEGLVPATAPGHKGVYRYFQHKKTGRALCFQVGRLHGYEGLSPRDVVKTVVLPKLCGTKKFLLTNASGSLDPTFKVASLMIINDHVNLTGANPLYGANPVDFDNQPLGPRFPDMSAVYDPAMRNRLKATLSDSKKAFTVVEGIYLGLLGPAYETPAEVKLYSNWGLGAVGMSTVWEAIALRHAGATLAGLSFISNLGCGLSKEPLRHEDVEREAAKIATRLVQALFDYAEAEISA